MCMCVCFFYTQTSLKNSDQNDLTLIKMSGIYSSRSNSIMSPRVHIMASALVRHCQASVIYASQPQDTNYSFFLVGIF